MVVPGLLIATPFPPMRNPGTLTSLLLGSLLASGCIDLGGSEARSDVDDDGGGESADGENVDRDACKIEGGDIGVANLELRLGTRTVVFHDWIAKTGEANEFVGFSITLRDATEVGYVVKAGGELHPSSATAWMHPAGPDGGSDAPGISNVDFCEECEDGSCDEPPSDPDGDCE